MNEACASQDSWAEYEMAVAGDLDGGDTVDVGSNGNSAASGVDDSRKDFSSGILAALDSDGGENFSIQEIGQR